MKKVALSLFLLILISTNFAHSNDNFVLDSTKKSIIKLEICFGGIQLEHRMKEPSSSLQFSTGYDYHDFGDPLVYDFQLVSEYRYYTSKKKEWPFGFYVGSYCFFKNFIISRNMESNNWLEYSRDKVKTAGIGMDVGYQMNLGKTNRFPVDITFGLGYNIYKNVEHLEGIEIIDESSYFLNFLGQITFGYVF